MNNSENKQINKQISPAPIQYPLVDKNGMATYQHANWLSSIKSTLEATTTNYKIDVPNVTTEIRDSSPGIINGRIIYNEDTHKPQMYVNGAWVNLV